MGRFRSPQSQAKHAVAQRLAIGKPSHKSKGITGKIHSLGTARTYEDSLTGVASFIAELGIDPLGKGLSSLSKENALLYLEHRSQEVGQKQLDKDRQAMQKQLGEKLPVLKSELEGALKSRAYTHQQVELIADAQTSKFSLASKIAVDAGLRAHELLTLRPLGDRSASTHRIWTEERFEGRASFAVYTVEGKGGLVREVAISEYLAEKLESLSLPKPITTTDREIFYEQFYSVGGGKRWSDSFSKASTRELGWSTGAHGVRHSYAQKRMRTLQSLGKCYDQALAIVSQEMGHFRPDITEVYLR